jgi:two-component system, cell cycle response regulator
VMPDLSVEIAAKVAERTRSAIQSEPFIIDRAGRAIPVTVSIGVAGRGRDNDPDSLYRRADRALYRSKSEGRNRVTADAA